MCKEWKAHNNLQLVKGPWRGSARRFSRAHCSFRSYIVKILKWRSRLIFCPLSFSIFSFLISLLVLSLWNFEKSLLKSIARLNRLSDKFEIRLISKLIHFLPKLHWWGQLKLITKLIISWEAQVHRARSALQALQPEFSRHSLKSFYNGHRRVCKKRNARPKRIL